MKFKVWDKKNKMWLDEKWAEYAVKSSGELIEIFDKKAVDSKSHLKPIYSTEKTDKNGVELFQGDIIKNDWRVFVVEWNKELASFKLKCLENGFTYDLNSFIDTLEKIGTTFENPELLEKNG